MAELREPSRPTPHSPSSLAPSNPNASGRARRPGGGFEPSDGPVRLQLVGALLAGVVLVASGLYLWRRPRHVAPEGASPDDGAAAEADDGGARVLAVVDAAPPPMTVSEARVVGCHDRGPKVTPPEGCDRIAPVEQAFSHAIEQSLSCVPQTDPGGTIEYVADVSFSRHKVRVLLPRSGRSVRDRKIVTACAAAVRDAMHSVALDGVDHQHARYQIAITATYRGKS